MRVPLEIYRKNWCS